MLRTRTALILTGLIIVVGVALAGLLAGQKETLKKRPTLERHRPLETISVKNSNISFDLQIGGTVSARDKIDLYAEVSGVLLDIGKPFREGQTIDSGEILIRIDDEVYHSSLLAERSGFLADLTQLLADIAIDFPESEATWKEYLDSFDIGRSLSPLPKPRSTKERNYIAARNLYSRYHKIRGMEAQWKKYTITAPFSGVITEARLNPGALVMNGQKLGEFANVYDFELDASIGLDEVNHIAVGGVVTLVSGNVPGQFHGVIERINQRIDRQSQTVGVYIRVRDERLKDGMYLTASIRSETLTNVMRVPKTVLIDGSALYIIEDSTLVMRPVEIVADHGSDVFISNLSDGVLILTEGLEAAFEGMRIAAYVVREGA